MRTFKWIVVIVCALPFWNAHAQMIPQDDRYFFAYDSDYFKAIDEYGPDVVAKIKKTVYQLQSTRWVSSSYCSGVAISKTEVMTAAHCFKSFHQNIQAKLYEDDTTVTLKPYQNYKHAGIDIQILKRMSGEFEEFVPVDNSFIYPSNEPNDRYLAAGFPIETCSPETISDYFNGKANHSLSISPVTNISFEVPDDFAFLLYVASHELRSPSPSELKIHAEHLQKKYRGMIFSSALIFEGGSGGPIFKIQGSNDQSTLTVIGIASFSVSTPLQLPVQMSHNFVFSSTGYLK